MRLGLNLPWVHCGHDFGPRPPAWGDGTPVRDWEGLGAKLREWREQLGVEVVRFWVLAGGVNYPVGENPMQRFALTEIHPNEVLPGGRPRALHSALVRGTWRDPERLLLGDAELPSVGADFLRDFEALFRVAGDAGVRLMPSLCSFELLLPVVHKGQGVMSRGRAALVFGDTGTDTAQIERFYDATLEPMLDVAARHAHALEAFEVINEPDWAVEGGPMHGHFGGVRATRVSPKTVRAPMMDRFLRRGVERILARDLRASIGFKLADPRWLGSDLHAQLARWGASGRYVHQLHHYPSLYEPRPLRRHAELPIQPCIVGEFPTRQGSALSLTRGWWPDRFRDLRRAAEPTDYLRRRLEIIAEAGYPMALPWAANSTDTMTNWTPVTRAQLTQR